MLQIFTFLSLSFISFLAYASSQRVGCWKRSAGAITATAILMLTACLLASGAMGLWHTVEFFEKEKVVGDEYFQQWPNVSSQHLCVCVILLIISLSLSLSSFRSCVTTQESHTTGRISSHGQLSHANSSPPFFSRVQPFASEASARRRNNLIFSI
jgi:hypothetical protein